MPVPSDSRDTNSGFSSDTSASVNSSVPTPVPNPYDIKDPAALKQIKRRMDERWKTANHRRWLFELSWLRNILFMLGIQWVRIDWPGREIRNLSLPTNFPRAITNKYAQVLGDLWAQLVQGDIPVNWMPTTDDLKDRSTAEICERLREVIDMEAKTRICKRDLGFWVTYAGNGFILPVYDYSPENGVNPVPLSQCNGCGMTSKVGEMDGGGDPSQSKPCPQCTVQGIPPQVPPYSPAVDPLTNQPQTEDIPIGRLKFEVLSPFEVYLDNILRIGSPQHWFFRPHRYDVVIARKLFPDFAEKISEGMNEPMRPSRNYLIAIAYAGSYLTGTTGTGEASAREEMRRQVTAWEYREDPTPEYPQGVYAVRLGDEIVELKPLPNTWGAGQLKGIPFHGLVHFHQEISGGAWAKPRANDLVSIQARRNIIDSNLQLTAQRTGAPKLLNPMGSGLKNVTGEAGQMVEYKPITFGGTSLAKPEYLEAALGNVQPLVALLKMLDDSMERIAGTFFLAGGDAPPGVTAACLTEDTECLTKRGWLKQNEVNLDDEIYTMNPDTQLGEWQKPLALNRYMYSGELIEIRNNALSATMTPNHAWYVGTNNNPGKKVQRVLAEELKSHHFIPASIPFASVSAGGNYSNAFVELIGWLVTEGNYSVRKAGTVKHDKRGDYTLRTDDWTVEISQSEKVNHINCESIRSCLKAEGFKFSESRDKRTDVQRFRIGGKAARKLVSQFPDKLLTYDFIHALSTSQLQLLCKTMLLADGHCADKRGGRLHHTRVFNSANPKLRDQFQMVATLAGNLTSQPADYFTSSVHKKPEYQDNMTRCSVKAARRIKLRSLLRSRRRVNYQGIVWCPTTANGTWVARREGRVFATGNSALAFLGERSNRALSPLKEQWAEGWGTVYQYAVEIARAHWTDQRVLAILGRNKQWQFEKFKMSDLTGSVNVTIDYEALFPKGDAAIRADLMQLAQMGVINPQDPEQNYSILTKFGQTSLKQTQDEATAQAAREWDDFITKGKPPVLIPIVQNAPLHLAQHLRDAMTQEFEILYATSKPQADIWIAHCLATQEAVVAASMPLIPPGPGAGGPPPSGPAGHPGSQHGSQKGPAAGNKTPAPIAKGEAAASAGEPGPPRPLNM